MKLFVFSLILLSFTYSSKPDLESVNKVLDSWHLAAANAQFEDYFNLMEENSVFIGTAPGERWIKSEFMVFSKPYFDKGKAWDFKVKKRNVTFS
ncbi:MAG: nuclear transport factor 2 family protein, partial [Flavobacteriia bacterium]